MTDAARELRALDAATARYRELEDATQAVIAAVVKALKAGAPPTMVVARSPFTAAYVRKLAREHGVPPARPGPKSKKGSSQ